MRWEPGLMKSVLILRMMETRFLTVGGRSYTQRKAETSNVPCGGTVLEYLCRLAVLILRENGDFSSDAGAPMRVTVSVCTCVSAHGSTQRLGARPAPGLPRKRAVGGGLEAPARKTAQEPGLSENPGKALGRQGRARPVGVTSLAHSDKHRNNSYKSLDEKNHEAIQVSIKTSKLVVDEK